MKLHHIFYAILLVIFVVSALAISAGLTNMARAETTYLIIPAHFWQDGYWRPTESIAYADWGPYNG